MLHSKLILYNFKGMKNMKKSYYSYAENGKLVINNNGTTDYVKSDEELRTYDFENTVFIYFQDNENNAKIFCNSENNLKLN